MNSINSMPNLNCNIRFFNAAPTSNIDIYLNDKIISKSLVFSKITKYKIFPAGEYELKIYDSNNSSKLLFSEDVVFLPQSTLTLSAIILESSLSIFTLTDGLTLPNIQNGYLRFINFSPDSPLLTLSLSNENILFNDVQYIESTNYTKLTKGTYDFLLSLTESPEGFKKYISNIKINKGFFYTIYIIGQFDGEPKLGYYLTKDGI